MNESDLTTLAVDWTDAMSAAVVLIIVFGSWIANKIKEVQTSSSGSSGGQRPAAPGPSPEDLESIGGTAGSRPIPGGSDDGEPDNLTLAERIERARARAQYRERAERLRESQGAAAPAEPAGVAPPVATPRTRPPSGPRPTSPRTPPPMQIPTAETPSRRPPRPALKKSQRRRPKVEKESPAALRDAATVAAVPKAKPLMARPPVEPGRPSLGRGAFHGSNLQQAVVLKEILDRPLALRDPLESLI